MSVVKINVLRVPPGRAEALEQRFAARAREVDEVDGFESFDLLRPTGGTDRYLVVTRWRDDAAFDAWMSSESFGASHARPAAEENDEQEAQTWDRPPADGPAATGSELWGFEVVTSARHGGLTPGRQSAQF